MEIIKIDTLGNFVERSDALGGPGVAACEAYWAGVKFDFGPTDMPSDPFSEEYVGAQTELYEAISGRRLDQDINEISNFDAAAPLRSPNPYAWLAPGEVGTHIGRLSAALKAANPPRGGKLLDMGCGWGVSAEICAYAGMSVTAVDINPDFVSLVRQRAESGKRDIEVVQATFDDFASDKIFDMILFYECFHHAVRPWEVLKRMKGMMAPGGALVLAGEPINDYWHHWGIRLDPLSIYCVRKFGWFESGWSRAFLEEMFARVGFAAEFSPGGIGVHEQDVLVARLKEKSRLDASELGRASVVHGWIVEPSILVSLGESRLHLPESAAGVRKRMHLVNNRPRLMDLTIRTELREFEVSLNIGNNEIDLRPGECDIVMIGPIWRPADELDTIDGRLISFHLSAVSLY